jgi:prolyl oligopeptidase
MRLAQRFPSLTLTPMLLSSLLLTPLATSSILAAPPETRRATVVDQYHGVEVAEDYRWLEDWESTEVKEWSNTQNLYARKYLDGLEHVESIRGEATKILSAESPSFGSLTRRGDSWFAVKHQPPKQQPFLVVMDSLDAPEKARVVLDPNLLDSGGTTAMDWFHVSPDTKWVAVSLSSGGSEAGNLSIYDTATGERVFEEIEYVNSGTAGGSLAWGADSQGFFYTRHFRIHPEDPNDINVYQHVYFHALGDSPTNDRYELGKGFPQIAEIQLKLDSPSGQLLATVQEGDGGKFAHHMRSADGEWRQFSDFGDGIKQAVFGKKSDLYLVSLQNAPHGKVLRLSLDKLRDAASLAQAEVVIPTGTDSIVTSGIAFWGENTVLPTDSRLYVLYQLGGPSVIRAFDHSGQPATAPEQLEVSTIHGLQSIGGDDVLFGNSSFIEADSYFHFDAAAGKTSRTKIADLAAVDFSDTQVIREMATSKDGTQIPLNIILPKGLKRDGSHPCILTAYGGYGINITPRFSPLNRMLLDRGVIYVVANLRGGGEFGEDWHRQGNLTRKQNVFDDFAAALEHLVKRQYTQPKRLGIIGGSNGGLLMGAAFTQHPELMAAVVSRVGIYDMLRVELSANGAFNVTEFGTVKDKDQFTALRGYSPYHNVDDNASYPPVMFVTGANDPRVDPMQSRKMTARLQAVPATKNPILLRTSANAGHGGDHSLSEGIEQAVDIYSFLLQHLQVPLKLTSRAEKNETPVRTVKNWPRWRGSEDTGSIVTQSNLPTQFSATDNVAWKLALPGKGCSTPIVWDETIYVTCPREGLDSLLAIGLDGKTIWQTSFGSEKPGKHRNGSGCNASPTTDGDAIYIYFKSGTLAAVEFDGKIRWQTNLVQRFGSDTLFWDHGTSPVLTKNSVVFARMHHGESWLAAFDKQTGEIKWKVARNFETPTEGDHGYATPVVIQHQGQEAILLWGGEHVTLHAPEDGQTLWTCGGFNPERKALWPSIATPVVADGMVIIAYGRNDRGIPNLHGLKLGADDARQWKRTDTGTFVPSPALYRNQLYLVRDRGQVECISPANGKSVWKAQFPKNKSAFYASPLIAGGKLYAAREDGVLFVASIDNEFTLLAENDMSEPVIASPVPVGDRLLVRGVEHLFCLENQQ